MRCGCLTWSARQRPISPPHISRQASSMACSTATISTSRARASITARGASPRSGIRNSPRLISTITASIRSAGSRRRSTGTSRNWQAACRSLRRRLHYRRCWRAGADRFEDALVAAMLRRLGVGKGRNDRELAAALINALALPRSADRPHLLRLARGARSGCRELSVGTVPRSRQTARRSRTRAIAPILVGPAPCSMHIEEVEAIWSAIAERDDWQPFNDKVTAVRLMGEAMEQDAPAG